MWKEGTERKQAEWTGEEQRFLGSHGPLPRGNRTLVCLSSMRDGLGTTEAWISKMVVMARKCCRGTAIRALRLMSP